MAQNLGNRGKNPDSWPSAKLFIEQLAQIWGLYHHFWKRYIFGPKRFCLGMQDPMNSVPLVCTYLRTFKFSGLAHKLFLIFCMMLGIHNAYKLTNLDF